MDARASAKNWGKTPFVSALLAQNVTIKSLVE
jgi:hypothetical protein